jgi:glycerate dehydrogenase
MKDKLNIVFLDAYTTNPGDLSWDRLEALGHLTIYDHTTDDQFIVRAQEADILITNKFVLSKKHLEQLPNLKLICVAATGMNNIDMQAAELQGIVVKNVMNYSTESVCQQVFAMLFAFLNRVEAHSRSVMNGDWNSSRDFSYTLLPIENVVNKVFGIVGFGNIGQSVARVAQAFDMKVVAVNKYPEKSNMPAVENRSLDYVLKHSDFISLHVPLNDQTFEMINTQSLAQMKSSAILINTGRGPLVNEQDLYNALSQKIIKGACLDVLTQEPPTEVSPLFSLENCLVTPHVAWAGIYARNSLIEGIAKNISDWKTKK